MKYLCSKRLMKEHFFTLYGIHGNSKCVIFIFVLRTLRVRSRIVCYPVSILTMNYFFYRAVHCCSEILKFLKCLLQNHANKFMTYRTHYHLHLLRVYTTILGVWEWFDNSIFNQRKNYRGRTWKYSYWNVSIIIKFHKSAFPVSQKEMLRFVSEVLRNWKITEPSDYENNEAIVDYCMSW